MTLKEATAELHSKAEKMEFNQRMFRGELSKKEYLKYLTQQLTIFLVIENRELPHPSLSRIGNIYEDIAELEKEQSHEYVANSKTIEYCLYLQNLSDSDLLAHVYLNYLALAYGGQMIKTKVPGSGKMYDFENMQECVGSIRAIQNDEMAEEVNRGFQYIINILDELQTNAG
jgi:heme oxygenase